MARDKKPTGQKKVQTVKATADMSTVARKLLKGVDGHNGFQTQTTDNPDLVLIRFSLHRQPQEIILSKTDYATAKDPVGYVEEALNIEKRLDAVEDRAASVAATQKNAWNAHKKGTAKAERKKLKRQQDFDTAQNG